jgi:hypothetical protein
MEKFGSGINIPDPQHCKKDKLFCTCNFSGSFCPFMVVISSGSERICFARVP